MDDSERLALGKAIEKRAKEFYKDVEDGMKDDLRAACEEDGTDRRAIRVGGVKVGELGVSYTKPGIGIDYGRDAEALAFLERSGLTRPVPVDGWQERFKAYPNGLVVFEDTGEVVDWAVYEKPRIKTVAVRGCEPEKVLDAFAGRLEGTDVFGLLEG